jgi:hypothetical protein
VLPIECREPYGRRCRVGPVDAMMPMRGDVEPVAGAEQACVRLVGKTQLCGTGEQQDAFAFCLVVPEPRRLA